MPNYLLTSSFVTAHSRVVTAPTTSSLPLDSASDRYPASNAPREIHDTRSLFDVRYFLRCIPDFRICECFLQFLPITATVLNACMDGDLNNTEELLTEEIHADVKNYNSYATRSIVRARGCKWDLALQDAAQVR